MATRFRLALPPEQAATLIMEAYAARVRERGMEPRMTPMLREHISHAAMWLTGTSQRAGMLLCGNTGNGKTTLLRAIQSVINLFDPPQGAQLHEPGMIIVSAKELVALAKAAANPTADNREQCRRHRRMKDIQILAIDDMGAEPRESRHYGDYVTAVEDIILHRYDSMGATIASTNLSTAELAQYYDARVLDRMREMMSIVNFGNEESFRRM